jgi:hypothetical protein
MPFHSKPKRLWDALRFAGLFIRTVGLKAGFEKLFRDARAFHYEHGHYNLIPT